MKLQKQFHKFRERFNSVFTKYLEEKEKELAKIDPSIILLFSHIIKIAKEGKRLRPFFCWLAYQGFGGKKEKLILKVGVALELFHLFALIHDDIIDKAKERRGVETIHYLFTRETGNKHFGLSVAILAGDLVFALAEEAFWKGQKMFGNSHPEFISGSKTKFRMLKQVQHDEVGDLKDLSSKYWQKLKKEVIVGQYLDILSSSKLKAPAFSARWRITAGKQNSKLKKLLIDLTMKVMELKTARYTVLRPLQIGASLAGARNEEIEKLAKFAIPAGIAFQIKDDMMDYQKEKGKNLVSLKGVKYCQQLAEKFAQKAKKALENVKIRTKEKELLSKLADFVVKRQS